LIALFIIGCVQPFPAIAQAETATTAELRSNYLRRGVAFPTSSFPLSQREATAIRSGEAPSIDTPPQGTRRYLSIRIETRPEYYVNVSRNGLIEQIPVEDPFATLDLEAGVVGGAVVRAAGVLQREWDFGSSANVPAPREGNALPFENNLLRTGYLYVPVGPLNVTFGRQQIHLGALPRNSLYASSRLPFLDALRATLRLGGLSMTSITSTLENSRATPDVEFEQRELYGFDRNTILYNTHHFEYAWPRLRIGLGSQIVVARDMNEFHLGDFFPVFSWHNADIYPHNMSLIADLSLALVPGLALHVQAGWDDINGEAFGFEDSEIPTTDAYVAGVERTSDIGAAELSVTASIGYTHYLWGSFHAEDALSRAVYRLQTDGPPRPMPLTSPYGPGALWFDFGSRFAWERVSAGLEYRFLGQKLDANLFSTPYVASSYLEEAAYGLMNTVIVDAEYRPWEWASLGVRPGIRFGSGTLAPQLEVWGSLRYELITELP